MVETQDWRCVLGKVSSKTYIFDKQAVAKNRCIKLNFF